MLKSFLLLASSLCLAIIIFFPFKPFISIPTTTYTYKTIGDLEIKADVHVPNITIQGNYPVALTIHGGGYIGGSRSVGCTPPQVAEMLSRGWCVVSIDYRLSPHALLDDMMSDIQDAYAWIRTELVNIVPIDIDSIIVWGSSGGGALATISGYMLSPRPQVIVSLYPGWLNFTDPINYNSTSPVPEVLAKEAAALMQPTTEHNIINWSDIHDPRIHLFLTAAIFQKLGWMLSTHDPNESVDFILEYLTKYSTMYYIDSNYPPTVLIHGLDDTLVPPDQCIQMAGLLAEANVPYLLNLVPGAIHGFDYKNITAQDWDDYILTAFDFAEEQLMSVNRFKNS